MVATPSVHGRIGTVGVCEKRPPPAPEESLFPKILRWSSVLDVDLYTPLPYATRGIGPAEVDLIIQIVDMRVMASYTPSWRLEIQPYHLLRRFSSHRLRLATKAIHIQPIQHPLTQLVYMYNTGRVKQKRTRTRFPKRTSKRTTRQNTTQVNETTPFKRKNKNKTKIDPRRGTNVYRKNNSFQQTGAWA